MDSVNTNFSVNNLPQMDRLQSDVHRTPVVNQDQNARLAEHEAGVRLTMPVEADAVENKNVDPDDKKKRQQQRGGRQSREKNRPPEEPPPAIIGPFSVDVRV